MTHIAPGGLPLQLIGETLLLFPFTSPSMQYEYLPPQSSTQQQQQPPSPSQAWQQQQQQQQQGGLAPPNHMPYSGGLTAAATGSSENLFDRSTEGFPKSAIDQSTAAKYRLEHHYSLSLEQAIERSERYFFFIHTHC